MDWFEKQKMSGWGRAPARPAPLTFLSACAEGVSVGTEGLCPAGRAFFLSRQKETKIRLMGCAPKNPPF